MRATGDHVLIEPDTEAEKTAGGIFLPTMQANGDKIETGIVVSIGINIIDERGRRLEPEIRAGDHVVFRRKSFTVAEPTVLGKKRLFVRYPDVLGAIEKGDEPPAKATRA